MSHVLLGVSEVAAYAGEREAFFFMFITYYTAMLPVLGIPNLIMVIYFELLNVRKETAGVAAAKDNLFLLQVRSPCRLSPTCGARAAGYR